MLSIKSSRSDRIFDGINLALVIVILLVMVYPLYFTVIASISDPYRVVNGEVFLWPAGFSLEAYESAFAEARLWTGYRNTIVYTVLGVAFNLFLTIPAAYVLSKKSLPGRGLLATFFIIPMYFGGGLVPTYLIVKDLGLVNKAYTLIFLGGLNIYNMIVARVYYQTSIPEDIYESARIDGASDFRMFFAMALPLSAAIIAVMALFYAVWHWNDYYTALIYISSDKFQPLQMVLRGILMSYERGFALSGGTANMTMEEIVMMTRRQYIAQSMKYALIFIASAPLLILYPFVQKYFVKGVMIGSLKG